MCDCGEHGVEAQVFTNGEPWQACRLFDRTWATQWAERVRAKCCEDSTRDREQTVPPRRPGGRRLSVSMNGPHRGSAPGEM